MIQMARVTQTTQMAQETERNQTSGRKHRNRCERWRRCSKRRASPLEETDKPGDKEYSQPGTRLARENNGSRLRMPEAVSDRPWRRKAARSPRQLPH